MEIECSPVKDAANQADHGMSLIRAREFNLGSAWVFEDDREDYGETRFVAVGYINRTLHTMVFTLRANVRVISLRKATKHERELYAANRPR